MQPSRIARFLIGCWRWYHPGVDRSPNEPPRIGMRKETRKQHTMPCVCCWPGSKGSSKGRLWCCSRTESTATHGPIWISWIWMAQRLQLIRCWAVMNAQFVMFPEWKWRKPTDHSSWEPRKRYLECLRNYFFRINTSVIKVFSYNTSLRKHTKNSCFRISCMCDLCC